MYTRNLEERSMRIAQIYDCVLLYFFRKRLPLTFYLAVRFQVLRSFPEGEDDSLINGVFFVCLFVFCFLEHKYNLNLNPKKLLRLIIETAYQIKIVNKICLESNLKNFK